MLTKLPFSFGLFAFHNWLGESQLGKLFNNAGIAKKRATIKVQMCTYLQGKVLFNC